MKKQAFALHLMQLFFCLTLVVGCSRSLTTPTLAPIPTPVPKPTKSPSEIQASIRPLLMVHYMPWYQTPSVSGNWGWHWTMDHFDPNQKDENGHLAIASHYYPLTGPYDSKDDAVLEYQVMLMKMSGIDGLIVDWYGFDNFWDYGTINTSTQKLFQYARKAGLLFAVCYEDRTIENMIKNGYLNSKEAVGHGQQTMLYLQNNWFREESYLKSSGHPVLFVFGHPPYFSASSDWVSLFSVLDNSPLLITEDDPLEPVASSSYPWPPMFMSQGGALTQNALNSYLTSFYKKAASWDYSVASAFPGFHDIYKEAGVGNSYGYLDSQNGETFNFTLQTALKSDPDIIQLVTWNDYGEGTNIEPTVEFGYQYLEMIQNMKRASVDKEFAFTPNDLSLPLQIFNLRRQYQADPQVNTRLDEAFNAIVSGRLETAKEIIATYNP